MRKNMFRLCNIYEFFVESNATSIICRIESFESASKPSFKRARVWLQNLYNLYPTNINTGPNGEDLKKVHSSDSVLQEITNQLQIDPGIITGMEVAEEELVKMLESAVGKYLS